MTTKHVKKAKAYPAKRAAKRAVGSNFYGKVRYGQSLLTPDTRKKTSNTRNTKAAEAKLKHKDTFVKDLVFVGMSFQGLGMDKVFQGIKDVCAKLKLKAKRVDENVGSGFIILEIVDLIEKAEFIIFDLSYERPNVYYELGYTHGVGNSPSNILLIAKDGTNLHFDILGLRVQYYKNIKDLKRIIEQNMRAMMKISRAG